ncbi:MAG: T9SS type A sorting domain-containing protein [Crocinitomicaceae bacterium]|nr:T9SS type A sorting domain-containing protein [Crocinitomicaceae bacterium]
MKKVFTIFLISLTFSISAQQTEFIKPIPIEFDVSTGEQFTFISSDEGCVFDSLGNYYFCGVYSGNADFDVESTDGEFYHDTEDRHGYLVKYNSSGEFQWVESFEDQNFRPRHVSLDTEGNFYLSGSFIETCDFDNSAAVDEHTSIGVWDCFIVKLDSNRNYIWGKSFGSINSNAIFAQAIDSAGNVYLANNHDGSYFDFDPGPGEITSGPSTPGGSAIQKFDSDGEIVWVKFLKDSRIDHLFIQDSLLYVTGNGDDDTDYDMSATGVHMLSVEGVFVSVNDLDGNYFWSKTIETAPNAYSYAVTSDPYGNVYFGGYYEGVSDFDPSSGGVYEMDAGADKSAFIVSLDSLGNFNWAKNFASDDESEVLSIAADSSGHVFFVGNFNTDFDINPNDPELILPVFSNDNGFLCVVDTAGEFQWYQHYRDFSHDVFPTSVNVNENGDIYIIGRDILGFEAWSAADNGLDAHEVGGPGIFMHKLSTCDISNSYVDSTVCDYYTVQSTLESITESGLYLDGFPSSSGCDSIIKIDLTILNSTSNYYDIEECYEYYWPVNGITYTDNVTETIVITNSVGCDSTITLDLVLLSEENTISKDGHKLVSDITGYDSYQWLKCPEMTVPSVGASIFDYYIPPDNEYYALVYEKNGCIDTTDCETIAVIGDQGLESLDIELYPNPSSGLVNIVSSYKEAEVFVFDLRGQLLFKENFSSITTIDLSQYSDGVYLFEVVTYNGSYRDKVVKQ